MTWWRRGAEGSLDPTVYTGLMGTAFVCLRSYEATGDRRDLHLCAEIVAAAAHTSNRLIQINRFMLIGSFSTCVIFPTKFAANFH